MMSVTQISEYLDKGMVYRFDIYNREHKRESKGGKISTVGDSGQRIHFGKILSFLVKFYLFIFGCTAWHRRILVVVCLVYFLAMPYGMWDLSALTRDRIHALCVGSTEA